MFGVIREEGSRQEKTKAHQPAPGQRTGQGGPGMVARSATAPSGWGVAMMGKGSLGDDKGKKELLKSD